MNFYIYKKNWSANVKKLGEIIESCWHSRFQHSGISVSLGCFSPSFVFFPFYCTDFRIAVFMWCFVSSVFLYSIAALIAFSMLRRHKLGKFYSVMILLMGAIIPCSLGLMSSAVIALVYKHSSFSMFPIHAMMWGVGQTVIHASVGFTRILATL